MEVYFHNQSVAGVLFGSDRRLLFVVFTHTIMSLDKEKNCLRQNDIQSFSLKKKKDQNKIYAGNKNMVEGGGGWNCQIKVQMPHKNHKTGEFLHLGPGELSGCWQMLYQTDKAPPDGYIFFFRKSNACQKLFNIYFWKYLLMNYVKIKREV